jgi:hypothetical protein
MSQSCSARPRQYEKPNAEHGKERSDGRVGGQSKRRFDEDRGKINGEIGRDHVDWRDAPLPESVHAE